MNSTDQDKKLRNYSIFPKEVVSAAVAAGLYPILFYFTNNFTLVNTWSHLGYFLTMFILLPMGVFWLIYRIMSLPKLNKWRKYILPFLSVFTFLFLLKVCLYAGVQKKMILVIILIAVLFARFLYMHLPKLKIIQFILAFIGLITLTPKVISYLNHSEAWLVQPDDIENTVFKNSPNVYFIQPDGYVSTSEMSRGYYAIDNSEFDQFLSLNNFKDYPDFRSNYASTLSSNSATFMMKHHHYNQGEDFGEAFNARDVIITKNSVLDVFKNNGYQTYFLAEKPYLLLNRPEMGYDYCNFDYKDISFIGTGLGAKQDIVTPLREQLRADNNTPKFFFIEIFSPIHIAGLKAHSKGADGEKEIWKKNLDEANVRLKEVVSEIKTHDPNALIVIMADHGGFVGMDYTLQTYKKTQERDIIYSIFSTKMAVHWPDNSAPEYDALLKTGVNTFRILFAYLSENKSYLDFLERDSSYVILNEDAPQGIYEYINEEGEITFKKQ